MAVTKPAEDSPAEERAEPMPTTPSNLPSGAKERDDVPRSAFLDPANRQYPYKRYRDGAWRVNCADCRDAIRVANFQKRPDIVTKAQDAMKRNNCM